MATIKLLAFSDPFPIEQDCIHLQNGVDVYKRQSCICFSDLYGFVHCMLIIK